MHYYNLDVSRTFVTGWCIINNIIIIDISAEHDGTWQYTGDNLRYVLCPNCSLKKILIHTLSYWSFATKGFIFSANKGTLSFTYAHSPYLNVINAVHLLSWFFEQRVMCSTYSISTLQLYWMGPVILPWQQINRHDNIRH